MNRTSHKCRECKKKFARKYNLDLHMRTAHSSLVEKLVCSECCTLISTMENMRVHIRRESRKKGKKIVLRDGKINGKPIKRVQISSKNLMNGRFYGSYGSSSEESSDDQSSSDDSLDNVPLAQIGQPNQSTSVGPAIEAIESIEGIEEPCQSEVQDDEIISVASSPNHSDESIHNQMIIEAIDEPSQNDGIYT